ncbi:MAG: DUF883 family protein, partial [Methylocella sp.]
AEFLSWRGCSRWKSVGGLPDSSNFYCHPGIAGGSLAYASIKPDEFTVDFKALRDDVAKMSAMVADYISSQTAATRNTVSDASDRTRQKVSETVGKTQDRVAGASADLEKTIERNPFVAVIVATFAGVLTGIMMGMLSPSRK